MMIKLKELLNEKPERDYKDEYKKFQSSTKSKKYRAELNKYNRQKGTYGNGDGKDASHKNGKIVGFEAESKNRGRAEKSRLKKEEFYTEQQLNEMDDVKKAFLLLKIYGQSWSVNLGKVFKGINNDKPVMIKKGLKEIKILNKKIEEMIEDLI